MFEAARQRSNQTDSPPQGNFFTKALPKYQIICDFPKISTGRTSHWEAPSEPRKFQNSTQKIDLI